MKDRKLTRFDLYDRTKTIGIDIEEVNLAAKVMDDNGDNVAYFGMNGYFLYSVFEKEAGGLQ